MIALSPPETDFAGKTPDEITEQCGKSRRRIDSIHSLAARLGIGVNTLKRLYNKRVFPDALVEKTPGGHWRVRHADIPELRARLRLWNFWHRKGLCRLKSDDKQSLTHSHPRQEELPPRGQVMNLKDLNAEGMAFALLQVNVAKLSQKKGRKTIRIKEIAAYMGIGVSTLYRVYGRDRLRAALVDVQMMRPIIIKA